MFVLLLIVFYAVSVTGQTPAPWADLSRLATARHDADDFAGALALRREALRVAEEKLGLEDKQLAALLANLALALHAVAQDTAADPFARRALNIAEQSGDKALTGIVLNALGVVLAGEGEMARAEPVLRRSVALLEESQGEDALNVAGAANNLATVYGDTGQYAKAEQELARALPIFEKHLGREHPRYALALSSMFTVMYQQHRANEGEPYLRRALAIAERAFPQSLNMAQIQHGLAAFEVAHENYKEAARILEKIIAMQERLLGPEHPLLARSLLNYSDVLRRMHQKAEAKQALNRANLILKSFH
jgi:tetratricopeptide (TPR) repeat protein